MCQPNDISSYKVVLIIVSNVDRFYVALIDRLEGMGAIVRMDCYIIPNI